MNDLSHHIRAYTILAGILGVGTWGIVWFSYDRVFQVVIAVAMCVSYAFWGISHHAAEEKLHLRIIVDYVAVAFLGLVLLLTLIYRA